MDFKKKLGGLMAVMAVLFINAGTASWAAVGTEDMPKSLKNKR